MSARPGLSIRGLHKRFTSLGEAVLNGVNLDIAAGETVAIIGRSGAGKSTLARCLAGLDAPGAGVIEIDGAPYRPQVRKKRGLVQMVWQHSTASLTPYRTIRESLREPLEALNIGSKGGRDARVCELIESVGLDQDVLDRRPHQLSGGECQRVVIARALATNPRVLVLDEPLSALDAPSQAEVIPVLHATTRQGCRAVLLISHDLTAVRRIATRVAVLHDGWIVEDRETNLFFSSPEHPAAREFLASWPALPFG